MDVSWLSAGSCQLLRIQTDGLKSCRDKACASPKPLLSQGFHQVLSGNPQLPLRYSGSSLFCAAPTQTRLGSFSEFYRRQRQNPNTCKKHSLAQETWVKISGERQRGSKHGNTIKETGSGNIFNLSPCSIIRGGLYLTYYPASHPFSDFFPLFSLLPH